MSPQVILLSGLPGTGKTRLAAEVAKKLHLPVLARDRFQSQLRLLGVADREGPAGYEMLFDQADLQLSLGIGVILDAVFPRDGYRQRARSLAYHYDAEFKPIVCVCSIDSLLRHRLEGREQSVPHWTPVGWEEVEKVRRYFEPWSDSSVLRLDAADEFHSNVSVAIDWIAGENRAR